MSLLRLVRRNLLRHPIRAFLTFGFAVLALFLLVFLRSALTTLDSALEGAVANRIVVQSATSLFVYMPESYRARIESVDGVESVCPWNWFGGYYQDPRNRFAQFACDVPTLLRQYPEFVIVAGSTADVLADRRGCLVGEDVANQYGWKVGDRIPITATIYAATIDEAWEFDIRAVYRSSKPNFDNKTLFFSYEYLRERMKPHREAGYGVEGQDIGVFMVKVKDGHDAATVLSAVDRMFENGPQKTATQTEAAFQAQFASMLGSIPVLLGWIGGAVLFAIFFSVLNTAGMAARERARDVGILKALGFRNRTGAAMLLVESMIIVGGGGIVGVALAWVSVPVFRNMFGILIPNYHVEPRTAAFGVLAALLIGLLGGLLPAIRLSRLRTVDVLREGA